jgi:hypothetical protein
VTLKASGDFVKPQKLKKMKTKLMLLSNAQGQLSRAEMKQIMAGDENYSHCYTEETSCSYYEAGTGNITGKCGLNSNDRCVCIGPNSSIISSQCSSSSGGGEFI